MDPNEAQNTRFAAEVVKTENPFEVWTDQNRVSSPGIVASGFLTDDQLDIKVVKTENPFEVWTDQNRVSSPGIVASGFLTDAQLDISLLIIISFVQIFNIAGIISNILNIVVLAKLGYSEPSNISLTALAASDLTCAVLSIWNGLCFLPPFRDSNLPFDTINVSSLTGAFLWAYLTRTSAWITAFISLERCLCVLMPLKVKRLITTKTTLRATSIIVILTAFPYFISYFGYRFAWINYPHLNATILNIISRGNGYYILLETILMIICGVIQPLLAFIIVIVCTIFLTIQLKKMSSWRKTATSVNSSPNPTQSVASSNRDVRLIRMVVAIASIFIVCFTPTCVQLVCTAMFKEFFYFGVYERLFFLISSLTALCQSVNGSLNIIMYYNMASKYRITLRRLFSLDS
ncbi:peptide receptor gpcr [Plakobranchus ocellatus]|uniref:Peptide receptor gpcr n=1 Tax=Plakobranchus ocellatus TaxID=259542 RepID=A0AAV4DNP9_9GAST|nr:peptide receptor gpcr [Plakobranchus ocellatus]